MKMSRTEAVPDNLKTVTTRARAERDNYDACT